MKKFVVIPIVALFLLSLSVSAQNSSNVQETVTIATKMENGKIVHFKITGITCAGCSSGIYDTLAKVDGVVDHSVEYPGDIAIIEFDNTKTSIEALKAVIEKKGYKAELAKEKA